MKLIIDNISHAILLIILLIIGIIATFYFPIMFLESQDEIPLWCSIVIIFGGLFLIACAYWLFCEAYRYNWFTNKKYED